MSLRLPDAELLFYFDILRQLGPQAALFEARVAALLLIHPDPGPGDVDRAIRAALTGLWTPPPDELGRLEGRWARRGDYVTKLERAE
jgi:hypothetical protein